MECNIYIFQTTESVSARKKTEAAPYDGYCQVYYELNFQATRGPTLQHEITIKDSRTATLTT